MTTRRTSHTAGVAAPADVAYRIVADVTSWPVHFPPTVHAVRLSGDDREERIRIWALANGALRTWVSVRRLDPAARTVEFEQAEPAAPVAAMGGAWRVEDDGDGGCRVELAHHYAAVGDDPEALALIDRAVESNSTAELDALRRAAEGAADPADLTLEFSDAEVIDGSVDDAYDFVNACDRWPERLPHVLRVELTEDEPGLQLMEMDTRSPDGSAHTTASGRVCVPGDRIVYKQTTVPPVMRTHNGEWTFRPDPGGGVRVTSRHTVVIDPDAARELAPEGLTLPEVRTKIRETLGANSRATLRAAKAHAEAHKEAHKGPRREARKEAHAEAGRERSGK
ncbi:aromatase/cyclase [Actinomadura rubrisoli]|uniref:Cyclase n=1 Tax=Actinomadura rubrisoli TaxID=2530368 RepID=A0A4R5AWT6_9ACTN|nr:aromatase/cyclase [Actinomadura rubrisoli]TDD76620.1 cyclase [Actinomadura rubrisoli]